MNILGIGRDKSQSYYFPRRLTKPEYETEEGQGLTRPPLGTGPPWPRQGMVWAPWPATDLAAFAYICPLMQKP